MTQELVVLVDEQNEMLGTMPKGEVYQARMLLHRVFPLLFFARAISSY
jgi:isopentenyldiphosphate isomerase